MALSSKVEYVRYMYVDVVREGGREGGRECVCV